MKKENDCVSVSNDEGSGGVFTSGSEINELLIQRFPLRTVKITPDLQVVTLGTKISTISSQINKYTKHRGSKKPLAFVLSVKHLDHHQQKVGVQQ